MKKIILTIFIGAVLLLTSLFMFVGCGNKDIFDMNYNLNYVLINEGGGLPVLHEVRSWSDADSDSATIRTDCCGNYIWTSSNNSTLYENIPDYLTEGVDYIKCSHIGE